ncbi:MAG: M24 family metallopeptidase [Ignavibacteriaceae bacterium]|jgi:Xaa-Pro aminopeptidase|nr:M24 family metallopeptidase [Ignavibacteriaceae bacterium]
MALNIATIQNILKDRNLDGWLLFDFRCSNDLALEILGIKKESHLTRRFFYFIPQTGEPSKIVNAIEEHNLAHLPGEKLSYSSHDSLREQIAKALSGSKRIAMEYSPLNAIPYLSKVDAGTIELIRTFDVEIVSSADLITQFTAVWSSQQYMENVPVAKALIEIVDVAFNFIKNNILAGSTLTEYSVQQFIMNEFKRRNLVTDFPPIVGVNENSANPHYAPDETTFKEIKENDFVLIDLWAKTPEETSVWSDITWVGFVGKDVPEKYRKIWGIVKGARDAAFNLVDERFKANQPVCGYEVDNASRQVIEDAGYGKYFIHRTGHSITTTVHGSGPHMDNFETKDERLLLPSTSFSIEPGIYLTGDFGIRTEIDVFIHPNGKVEQTSGIKQEEIVAILK